MKLEKASDRKSSVISANQYQKNCKWFLLCSFTVYYSVHHIILSSVLTLNLLTSCISSELYLCYFVNFKRGFTFFLF